MKADWDQDKLRKVAASLAAGSLRTACVFLVGQLKKVVSEPAPRKRVIGKRGANAGVPYYRATTPATFGAPPRKLSGALRQSIRWVEVKPGEEYQISVNVPYAARHEQGAHPFVLPTVQRFQAELLRVAGGGTGS